MADDAAAANTIANAARNRSVAQGDIPDALKRRYFIDGRGGAGLGFYVDAQVKTPSFRDQGRKLVTPRNDPNAIRDMVAIAGHRDWTIVTVSGTPGFRREAWLAARGAGLEVRGYRPTERDLQELDRRSERLHRAQGEAARAPRDASARATLSRVEAVVRSRISDPEGQDRLLLRAERRVADWLARGAVFARPDEDRGRPHRERSRSR